MLVPPVGVLVGASPPGEAVEDVGGGTAEPVLLLLRHRTRRVKLNEDLVVPVKETWGRGGGSRGVRTRGEIRANTPDMSESTSGDMVGVMGVMSRGIIPKLGVKGPESLVLPSESIAVAALLACLLRYIDAKL